MQGATAATVVGVPPEATASAKPSPCAWDKHSYKLVGQEVETRHDGTHEQKIYAECSACGQPNMLCVELTERGFGSWSSGRTMEYDKAHR